MNNPYGGLGSWAVEHDDEMRRLSNSGVSYRAIALALNAKFGTHYTKSATIGRASRIGLTKKSAPSTTLKVLGQSRKAPVKRLVPREELEQYKLRCVEIVPQHLSLIDLEPGDCRYPYGDGPMTFCGHPKQADSSYCTPHHFLCCEAPRAPIRRFAGLAA